MTGTFYEQPILNSPYEEPALHHALDEEGQPTDNPPIAGRRRSELITPVPKPRKRRNKPDPKQATLDWQSGDGISTDEQEYNPTPIINEIRSRVADWRRIPSQNDWGVTPVTARLLQHWRHHDFQGIRPFFCQIEAVETVIWLTEVARKQKTHKHIWDHIQGANEQANPELIRLALKMATGAGKTTVMAMLMAWQTVNAVRSPTSKLFTRGFLIVSPGITIKDRLRVLQPNDPNSYYRSHELVPADMLDDINKAKIVITNYHAFQLRELMGTNKVGRSLLQGRGEALKTQETEGQMVRRVAEELMGFKNIVVINDEAHHCYREKPDNEDIGDLKGDEKKEAKKENESARVWINGLEAGLQFHRIDKSKDQNFWSIRSNRDIRVIVHKTASSFLICYVDHHDDAYKWAERRRIETHPKTGAAQIVEVRERVEEITIPVYTTPEPLVVAAPQEQSLLLLFHDLSEEDLLDVGVPQDWIADVRQSTEDGFFEITDHIPAEAAEALLDYVVTGMLRKPEEAVTGASPFDHPDAQRRFRVLEDVEELTLALEYPWDQWAIFLHPSQRRVVEQEFSGPARVSGSAGTGKTVVALHRAAAVLKKDKQAKVLLTTFSSPLSNALEHKLRMLTGNNGPNESNVTILPFKGVAYDLFTLAFGHTPRTASKEQVKGVLESAAKELEITSFTIRFLVSEWNNVIDAWQIDTLDAYRDVPRLGRKNRLGSKQRERVWPVFVRARELLEAQGLNSWSGIFGKVTAHFAERDHKPFSHIIVDEAQDLGVPELRMLAAIADQNPGALFFAGDLGHRIFQEPFSWKALGIDIRGRSHTLTVNYRTSHQIRQTVDRLLPQLVRDVDGNEEDRRGTVSVFNGPDPEMKIFDDSNQENKGVALWVQGILDEGIEPDEIGVFVRSNNELLRARAVVKQAGQTPLELSDRVEDRNGRISIGTMHLAKGLEFKAVVVMACDDDILPLQERIETVADETELDEVYETERHLFYVACTRARDRLLVSGVEPASEFFADLTHRERGAAYD